LYAYVENNPANLMDPLGTGPNARFRNLVLWIGWWTKHTWPGQRWLQLWWPYPKPPSGYYFYPNIPPRLVGGVGSGGGCGGGAGGGDTGGGDDCSSGGGGGGGGSGDGSNGDGNLNGDSVGANWVPPSGP